MLKQKAYLLLKYCNTGERDCLAIKCVLKSLKYYLSGHHFRLIRWLSPHLDVNQKKGIAGHMIVPSLLYKIRDNLDALSRTPDLLKNTQYMYTNASITQKQIICFQNLLSNHMRNT